MKETEDAEASKAATIVVYTAKDPPTEGVGYEVNYGPETLTVTPGYEVNTEKDFSGTTIFDGDAIQPGSTYYVRAADSDGDDGLTIPLRQ